MQLISKSSSFGLYFLDRGWEEKRVRIESWGAFPEFLLLLTSTMNITMIMKISVFWEVLPVASYNVTSLLFPTLDPETWLSNHPLLLSSLSSLSIYLFKNKLRGRSSQANYTDRATAALRVEGVAWSVQRIPTAVNLGFLNRSRYFFIQVAPQLSSRGWVDTVPDPLLLRKSGRAGNRTRKKLIL
jgi:hypothetical protein